MDLNAQINQLFEDFLKTQTMLWDRWSTFARQLETPTPGDYEASSADALKILNEQAQSAIELNKAWARLWVESLDHSRNLLAMLAAGNRRLLKRQAEAHARFERLSAQVRDIAEQVRVLDVNQAWVRQWIESLDQDNGLISAMVAWNRQIIERQDRAREQFLATWFDAFENLDPFNWPADAPSQDAFETLQEAINKAMAIPFGVPPAPGDVKLPAKPAAHRTDDDFTVPTEKAG